MQHDAHCVQFYLTCLCDAHEVEWVVHLIATSYNLPRERVQYNGYEVTHG